MGYGALLPITQLGAVRAGAGAAGTGHVGMVFRARSDDSSLGEDCVD